MWKELHLTPVSSSSSSDDIGASFTITTHLTHAESVSASSRQPHKLGIDVPFCDLRPPTGIIDVPCRTIHVKLVLSRRKRRRKHEGRKVEAARPRPPSISPNDDVHSSQVSEGHDFCDIFEDDCSHVRDDDPFAKRQESALFADDDESECELLEFVESPTHDPPELFNQVLEQITSYPHGSSSGEAATTSQGSLPHIEELLHAIEAGLECVIVGSSRHSAHGFSAESCSIYPLSEAAPAIWSPGHLASVAKRSVFIPTIASAIFNVLGAQISETSGNPAIIKSHPQAESCSSAGASAACSLSSRIWDCMLLGLDEKTAARKLRPLSEISDGGTAHHGVFEQLLDCWEADCDDADISNNAEEYFVPSVLHGEPTEMPEDEPSPGANCDISKLFFRESLENQDDAFYSDTIDLPPNLQFIGGAWKPRNDPSSIPDDRLYLAEAEATSTWQSGEFKLNSKSGQPCSLPSQSLEGIADFTACDAKQDHYYVLLQTEEDVGLPEEECSGLVVKGETMFEDFSGDEMVIKDADVRKLPSDDCEMLLL